MRTYFPLFCLLTIVWACKPTVQQTRVEMSQLARLDSAADATPLIRNYLAAATSNTEFMLPRGIYHIYPEKAVEKYCIISNHDHGIVRIGFDLSGAKNITIDGQGSKLIFHGDIIPFNLENATDITLRNLSIDWARPFHSEGTVVAVDSKNKTFDIKITEQYPYRIEGNQLIWLRDKDQSPWNARAWTQDVRINLFFDSQTKATAYKVKNHKLNPYYPLMYLQYKAWEIEPRLVRILDTIAELPEPGWIWASKGGLRPVRLSPAIRMLGCKDIQIQSVNVYHAGGMGILGERTENVLLKRVTVGLPPDNPDRIVSSTADATHFVNCRGQITIDSCLFENMLDDATNIHGQYLKLTSIIGPNTVGASAPHHEQSVNRFAAPGDTLCFRNNNTLEAYKKLVVKTYTYVNEYYAEIEFDGDVEDLKPNSGIENLAWYPSFSMTNSTVRNNRARSILLSTNKPIVIENNRFIRPMMAAISISGDMNYWFESGNVTDILIKNNYFEDACTGGFDQAVITIEPVVPAPDSAKTRFHAKIRIDSNIFRTFDHAIIDAFFVDGIAFTNNTVEQTNTYQPILPDKPSINLRYSRQATITGNKFTTRYAATVVTDRTSEIVSFVGNQGLSRAD